LNKHNGALLNLISGSVPMKTWPWAHGWQIEPKCEVWGELEHVKHIWLGCHGIHGDQNLQSKFQKAIQAKEVPPLVCSTETRTGWSKNDIGCCIKGLQVDWDSCYWLPGVVIYTGECAKNIRWKGMAVPAAAAYQIGPDCVQRHMPLQLPRHYPQSAVAAEFLVLLITCIRLPEGHFVTIAADCQAVVTAFKDLIKFDNYRSKSVGMLRESGINKGKEVV
jgi:hypothetical protein